MARKAKPIVQWVIINRFDEATHCYDTRAQCEEVLLGNLDAEGCRIARLVEVRPEDHNRERARREKVEADLVESQRNGALESIARKKAEAERDEARADVARLQDLHARCAAFDDQPGPSCVTLAAKCAALREALEDLTVSADALKETAADGQAGVRFSRFLRAIEQARAALSGTSDEWLRALVTRACEMQREADRAGFLSLLRQARSEVSGLKTYRPSLGVDVCENMLGRREHEAALVVEEVLNGKA